MPDRAPGFYWVRRPGSTWTIGEWSDRSGDGCAWTVVGEIDNPASDADFAAIGPRIESPEEMADERAACLAIVEGYRAKNAASYASVDTHDRLGYAFGAAEDVCEEIADDIKARGPVAAPKETQRP